jgi:membrane protease subunit HflK
MEPKRKFGGVVPIILSSAFMVAISVLMFVLYSTSKYLPYLLAALAVTLFIGVNLLLSLLGMQIPMKKPCKKPCEQVSEAEDNENAKKSKKKLKGLLGTLVYALKMAAYGVVFAYNKIYRILQLVLFGGLFVFLELYFGMMLKRMTSVYVISLWQPVLFIVLLVVAVILDKWCKHVEDASERSSALLGNLRVFFYLTKLILILVSVSSAIKLLNFGEIQKYIAYIITAIYYYASAMILVSVAVDIIRRELSTRPKITIPLPFASGDTKEFGVISFLEKNTGITMRGLWSMRLIKNVVPYSVIVVVLLFWISTGIVQVESYQEGAVYRLGKLTDDTLKPGIHMTLPYPIDKVELYDTETVNKMTIGYAAKEDTDNLWTGTHGTNEHKLLLGNGNELVSLNLRVEYKISDLQKYLRTSSNPASILESQAYALITDRIISTNLETLLSVDRDAFTESYTNELKERFAEYDVGLEVVSVVLESIHPPLEIAAIYQQVIGAEIEAEEMITRAQSKANVKITAAEAEKEASINAANAEYYQKKATAISDVAEFNASVEAANGNPEAYHYYKYLNAMAQAYGKSKLVIVGEGVDSSKIFFGNLGNVVIN